MLKVYIYFKTWV